MSRGVYRYSTAAVLEDPIKPPVSVQYDKLLINGQFVAAASGEFLRCFDLWRKCFSFRNFELKVMCSFLN